MVYLKEYEEVDLFNTEVEKERDEILHLAREAGIITNKEYVTTPDEELLRKIQRVNPEWYCEHVQKVNMFRNHANPKSEHVHIIQPCSTLEDTIKTRVKIKAALRILELLAEPNQHYTQEIIIEKAGTGRTSLWKYLNDLENLDYIVSIRKGKFKYYKTTKKGRQYLEVQRLFI